MQGFTTDDSNRFFSGAALKVFFWYYRWDTKHQPFQQHKRVTGPKDLTFSVELRNKIHLSEQTNDKSKHRRSAVWIMVACLKYHVNIFIFVVYLGCLSVVFMRRRVWRIFFLLLWILSLWESSTCSFEWQFGHDGGVERAGFRNEHLPWAICWIIV